ncbi:MAG: thioesterase [Flavobacterium sp.]|uniref:acyl-[acyl-carrier-protein] thioesterase n=1 Tax=Flavobacterium sp. TaxID=239 RepID=UPI0022BE83A7|nr:acyl-ACP thioesterase domain-containing protein [Flavobacterium sp.]MCZ8331264.1 thioesterase [Flavobacterium sp.]
MPISPNFTSILQEEKEINFLQCYPNGYLKYTDLCNILQLTAGLHAELGCISFSDMQVFHQAWVLSRMRVEIKRLPKWRDVVMVKTWIKSLENSRSVRCLELYVGDEKIVGCETFWAVINTNKRKPESLALPHEHFEKFPENATEKKFSKIVLKEELEILENYTVRLSDLDVVNHANNVKYLEWCLNNCVVNQLINNGLKAFEMNFMRELSLGDEAVIGRYDDVFVITNNNKACFALQLEWN